MAFTGKDNRTPEQIEEDHIKTMLQVSGVTIKSNRIRGNQDCPCGSEMRYDQCCGDKKDGP